jgi:hypothetical protein
VLKSDLMAICRAAVPFPSFSLSARSKAGAAEEVSAAISLRSRHATVERSGEYQCARSWGTVTVFADEPRLPA